MLCILRKPKYRAAPIWKKPARAELTDHEKQFTYLPLNLLDGATNIRELLLDSFSKVKEKYLDNVIDQIHQQMPQTCGHWLPELANLRFVEVIGDDDADDSETTNILTKQKHDRVNTIVFIVNIASVFFTL